MDFLDLVKLEKKDASTFPEFRLAVLADSATQFLAKALKGVAYEHQIRLELFDPGIGLGTQSVLDPHSALYQFQPSLTLFYFSLQSAEERFVSLEISERAHFAELLLQEVKQLVEIATAHGLPAFLLSTFPVVEDSVFGQLAAKLPHSFHYQTKQYNYLLTEWAAQTSDVFVWDLATISSSLGHSRFFDSILYYSAKASISFQALPFVAESVVQHIKARQGNIKKCVIFDLDNTIWGGVVGDDGLENLSLGMLGKGKVFSDIQTWLKELQRRGILLCACSKNEEKVAMKVFDTHPDMVLRRHDLVSSAVNWHPKNENVAALLQLLNIGEDSVVYLDDNPAERDLIRRYFPAMAVPELPQDPALWLSFLSGQFLFETISFSSTDRERTQLYQQEQKRREAIQTQDLSSYLRDLGMKATPHPLNAYTLSRVAQLSQRTNQFNLRTHRYTEAQLSQLMHEGYVALVHSLEDKFGNHGIVSVCLLKPEANALFIDTWLMSCRVFGRGLEHLVFEQLLSLAKEEGKQVKAEYLPTDKNKPVETLLPDLGFQFSEGFWYADPAIVTSPAHLISLLPSSKKEA